MNSNNSETKGKKVHINLKLFTNTKCSGQAADSATLISDEENLKCKDGNTMKDVSVRDKQSGRKHYFDTKSGECHKITLTNQFGQPVQWSVKFTWSGWCDRLPGWAIAITVVCVLLFVAGVAAAVYCCCCKNKKKQIYNQQRSYPANQQNIYQSGRSSNEQKI